LLLERTLSRSIVVVSVAVPAVLKHVATSSALPDKKTFEHDALKSPPDSATSWPLLFPMHEFSEMDVESDPEPAVFSQVADKTSFPELNEMPLQVSAKLVFAERLTFLAGVRSSSGAPWAAPKT